MKNLILLVLLVVSTATQAQGWERHTKDVNGEPLEYVAISGISTLAQFTDERVFNTESKLLFFGPKEGQYKGGYMITVQQYDNMPDMTEENKVTMHISETLDSEVFLMSEVTALDGYTFLLSVEASKELDVIMEKWSSLTIYLLSESMETRYDYQLTILKEPYEEEEQLKKKM